MQKPGIVRERSPVFLGRFGIEFVPATAERDEVNQHALGEHFLRTAEKSTTAEIE